MEQRSPVARQHQRIRKRQLPVCLSDGVTIYYATDGEGLGGYDILSLVTTQIRTLI